MHHYCAVWDEEDFGIYECGRDEDIESWQFNGKPIFKNFDLAINFEAPKKLKIGKEFVAVSIEVLSPNKKKEHDFVSMYSSNLREVSEWINTTMKKYSGKNTKYKPSLERHWTDEFTIGGFEFIIAQIGAQVKPDPREIPWQVKFELGGIKYQLDIDPIQSGFEEYYNKLILPRLETFAEDKEENLTDDEEIQRQLLPIVTKIMAENGIEDGFKGKFLNGEIQTKILGKLLKHFDKFVF